MTDKGKEYKLIKSLLIKHMSYTIIVVHDILPFVIEKEFEYSGKTYAIFEISDSKVAKNKSQIQVTRKKVLFCCPVLCHTKKVKSLYIYLNVSHWCCCKGQCVEVDIMLCFDMHEFHFISQFYWRS